MAYYFDEFGQYVEYETEEERKRRDTFNNTAVQTQEIKTYGDGTVERITKEEVPGDYAPAIQPVATQPVQRMPVQQPVAPVAPDMSSYNANIARQESGNRPDIGFHNQAKSSAYGTYGLTNAAYTDARKLNPALPADIRQATPEQQTAAQTAFTQQNAGYLQNLGIDPTPNNLAAAHFLGAQGLSNYLRDGSVSEAAARANGGADNVRRIVQQRLGGAAAPASAAAQPAMTQPAAPESVSPYSLATGQSGLGIQTGVAPTPASGTLTQDIDRYQSIQDNLPELMKTYANPDSSEFLRKRSGEQINNMMNQEVKSAEAKKRLEELGTAAAAGDRKANLALSRELQNKEGSYLKMILLGFISPALAGEEAVKLGYGNKWTTTTDANGKSALIQVNAKGLPLKGYTADGNEIATNELVKYAAGGKKQDYDIVGGTFVSDTMKDKDGRPLVGSVYRSKTNPDDNFVQTAEGRKPLTGFRPQSSTGTLDNQRATQIQRQNIELATAWEKMKMDIEKSGRKATAEDAARFNFKFGTNISPAQITGAAPQISMDTGQISQSGAAPASGQSAAEAAVAGSGGKITPLPTTQAAPAGGAVPPTPLPAGTAAPAAASKLPPAPMFRGPGFENESPSAFESRTKAWTDTYGKMYASNEKNVKEARSLLPFIGQMKTLIDQSTSSGIGSMVDSVGNFVGYSTKGAEAISAIGPLASKVLMGVERFEGPQSDKDVSAYKEAAGRLNDPSIPAAQKQAAFNTIIEIMKRNAPELDWDSALQQKTSKPFDDADKEKRYQEYLKKRNSGR